MENRDQSGKFLQGTNGGPGRPRGKSAESRMKDAMPDALDVLIDAAKAGDVHAAAAILDRVWPVESAS